MKTKILLLLVVCACGCQYRKIKIPYKAGTTNAVATYTSAGFGNKEGLKEVTFKGPNGEQFTITGFSRNQVDGLEKFSEGAARGAVQGMMGQYKLSPKNDASSAQPEIP